jgi:hypothetical protein
VDWNISTCNDRFKHSAAKKKVSLPQKQSLVYGKGHGGNVENQVGAVNRQDVAQRAGNYLRRKKICAGLCGARAY